MKPSIPNLNTPVDPFLFEWIHTIPEEYVNKAGLLEFLLRICHGIYDGNGIARDSNVNPFYKIIELLRANKLEYWHLQKLNEYYHFDIVGYLVSDNIAECYVGYPCYNAADLQKALKPRNNKTGKNTLADILSNIV